MQLFLRPISDPALDSALVGILTPGTAHDASIERHQAKHGANERHYGHARSKEW